ncbi:protein GRIM REAPER-like [Malania oleifera]|uniref:protein GRIM REAPER-like n=1 Tax=Malania oleifera TaxID=397392 RepID=UPI0025AE1EAC|nr:protein GRIM REAPER-like [Malania oleifera]
MAATLFQLTAILLTFTLPLTLLASPFPMASLIAADAEDYEEYVIDTPLVNTGSLRGRYMASIMKKGTHCEVSSNKCNGILANNGASLLFCCKKHCRNVLRDRNNCGRCGHKCGFGQLCCGGKCTNVGFDALHCGKCNKKCDSGVKCEKGSCGYAS